MEKTKVVASSAIAAAEPSATPPAEAPVARSDSQVVDKAISDDIARGVACIVFASRLAELAEMKAAAEALARSAEADLVLTRSQAESLVGERDAAEKALDAAILERDAARRDLYEAKRQAEVREAAARMETDRLVFDLENREETIRSLKRDKAGMEETIGSFEESLSNASDKLQWITGEKIQMEKDLERAIGERDARKRNLDTVTEELQMATAELKMTTEKMISSLVECVALKAGIVKMRQEFDQVKSKISADMDAMMEMVRTIQCKKEALKEEKNVLKAYLEKATDEKNSLCKLSGEQLFQTTYLQAQADYFFSTAMRLSAEKEDADKLWVRMKELEKNKNDGVEQEIVVVEEELDETVRDITGKLNDGVEQEIVVVEEELDETVRDITGKLNDGVEQEIVVVEEGLDETVRDITGELEIMKTVVKRSAEVIQARDEEIQELRGAMEAASKKSVGWLWDYPTAAATLAAAIAWALTAKR